MNPFGFITQMVKSESDVIQSNNYVDLEKERLRYDHRPQRMRWFDTSGQSESATDNKIIWGVIALVFVVVLVVALKK